jgi:aquaporin Z
MGGATTPEVVGEFIGTYILVLTVGCNVLFGNGVTAGLAIASSLMVAIFALRDVSGAHFNPAVSFALLLKKEIDAGKAAIYMVTQIIAGIAAGMTYATLVGNETQSGLEVVAERLDLGPGARPTIFGADGSTPLPAEQQPFGDLAGAKFGAMPVLTVEVLYTFFLVFVVLRSAVSSKNPAEKEYFPIAIAFTVLAGAYGAGVVSGGCFNPAVAIGIDVTSAWAGVEWCIPYALAEFVGAALAVGVNAILDGEVTLGTKCLSEFVGTFFLVLTVGLNVTCQSAAGALSIAGALIAAIYACGNVSGAHLNPAVSTALLLSGRGCFPMGDYFPYCVAQLLGGAVAGLTYTGIVGVSFPLGHGTGFSWADVTFAEFTYTFVLCFTVLNVASPMKDAVMMDGGKSTQLYGLIIGFCIVAGGWAIGSISGGALNPAVALGIDVAHATNGFTLSNCLLYTAFEMLGAGLAAVTFSVLRVEEYEKDGPKRLL